MRNWKILAVLLMVSTIVSSTTMMLSGLVTTSGDLCTELKNFLPIVAMLMIVVAGVIYAAGQMMGAETRARANVWATAALTGALIAILIYAIAPAVLGQMYQGSSFNC